MDLKFCWRLGLAGFARLCPGDQYEVSKLFFKKSFSIMFSVLHMAFLLISCTAKKIPTILYLWMSALKAFPT